MISAQGENGDDDELFADPLIPFRTKTSNYLTHHTQKLKHARNERRSTKLKRILFRLLFLCYSRNYNVLLN